MGYSSTDIIKFKDKEVTIYLIKTKNKIKTSMNKEFVQATTAKN